MRGHLSVTLTGKGLVQPLQLFHNPRIRPAPLVKPAAGVPWHTLPDFQHQIIEFIGHPRGFEIELVEVAPFLKGREADETVPDCGVVESCTGIRSIAAVSAALSKTTPVMLEGLADHLWTWHEFFIFN